MSTLCQTFAKTTYADRKISEVLPENSLLEGTEDFDGGHLKYFAGIFKQRFCLKF